MARAAFFGAGGLTWWACGRAAVAFAQGTWLDDVTRGDQASERRAKRIIAATGPVGLVAQLAVIAGGSAVMAAGVAVADAIDRRHA